MMYYELDELDELCREIGFTSSRTSSDVLEVSIVDDAVLLFQNLRDEEDTAIGFKGTAWHSHDKLFLMLDKSQYCEVDVFEILKGLKSGDILIIERYKNNVLDDRWLAHKNENVDVQYIEPGAEMRVRRLA
jgi:hypothetical protein